MSGRAPISRLAACLAAMIALTGCMEPISEPWASGEWGQRLDDERNRSFEQQQTLRGRLEGYADPYR